MPTWRILLLTSAMCGIQVCYAAQINLGTAHLLLLGINERTVSLAWLAGPLSGLIVQPLVGYASDSCTSPLGKRRPFLIAGSLLTAASLLLFPNTLSIARHFFPDAPRKPALLIAVFAFFMLDFSVQAVQAPLRALVTDVVPKRQRSLANSLIAFFVGVGNLISGLLAGLELNKFLPFHTDVQALFAISALVLILTVFATVLSTHENSVPLSSSNHLYAPVENTETQSTSGRTTKRTSLFATLRHIPRPFWHIFAVNLSTWSGFFTLFVYVNSWVGRNVFLGDGTAPAHTPQRMTYERGVRLGAKANALTALVTLAYSLVLPRLQDTFGILSIYVFAQLVEALCLMAAPFINGIHGQHEPSTMLKAATFIDIALFGIVWGTTVSLPWTLIGNALESDPRYSKRIGLFTTLFNVSLSFPQLVVAFVAPFIMSFSNNDPSMIMFCGGLCAAFGAFLAIYLRVDQFNRQDGSDKQAALSAKPRMNSKQFLSIIVGDQKPLD